MSKKKTPIDIQKQKADYRITGVLKGKYELRDKDSRYSLVTKKQLDKLRLGSKIVPDF